MAVVLLVVLPEPSTVSTKPAVVTPADSVNVPPTAVTVAAEPSVTVPDQVLPLARFRSAPPTRCPFR